MVVVSQPIHKLNNPSNGQPEDVPFFFVFFALVIIFFSLLISKEQINSLPSVYHVGEALTFYDTGKTRASVYKRVG